MKREEVVRMKALVALPEAMSYSAVIIDGEPGEDEQVITELMMRRACDMMHEEQQFPFCSVDAPAPQSTDTQTPPCAMHPRRPSVSSDVRASVARVHRLDLHRKN